MALDKNAVAKEAQKFVAKGQFDKAVLEWRKLLKDYPSDSSIFNTIGDLCLKRGDAKGKTEAVEAYYRAGTILAAEGFSSKAIAVFKKVLNIDPNKVEVHLALGDMNAEKGLTSAALESYKIAADRYKQNKEMRKALGIYQKMADLNPSNGAFKLKLADMYAKENMKAEAIQTYLEAADTHIAKEAFQDARQMFEKALALDPSNKQVYHKAGIVYFKEGKFVEACKTLKSVYENDPSNRELSELYLEALTKAGRDDEAEELCQKLLSTDAGRIDLREKLFHIYLTRKEHDKALAEAAIIADERLKARDVAGTEGQKMLPGTGEAELDEGTSRALEDLKAIVAESPEYAQAHRTLGDFYAKVGRGSDAAEELMRAAEILIGDGDKDSAKAALARAIELAPDMAEAKQRLESLKAPAPAPPMEAVAQPAPEAVPPAAPVAAAAAAAEEPAISDALAEIDVLIKYGLTSKASEQLEGLAKKFPESAQIRMKLRDLYADQGNVTKAVAHMLVLADLYAKNGAQDQAESVLRKALELDPRNTEVQSRLGAAPAAIEEAPAAEELMAEEPAGEMPELGEVLPLAEEQAGEITAGFEAPPELGEELAAPAAPVEETEQAAEEPVPELPAAGEITFGEALTAPETPAEEPPAPEEITFGEQLPPPEIPEEELAAPGETAAEEPLTAPALPEGEPLIAPEEAAPAAPPESVFEKPKEQPAAPAAKAEAPAPKAPEKEPDLKEIWAEAEFYYQQGLFDEAKKHYARIIQHDPSDMRAIERLHEISKEAEQTQAFSKLTEAVDELEGAAAGGESGGELATSASDEEAVRSLMKEIAQLKPAAAPPQPKAPAPKKERAAPAPAPREATPTPEGTSVSAADDEAVRSLMREMAQLKQQQAAPPREETSAGRPGRPAAGRPEENFFDLGEELRGKGAPAGRTERKEAPAKRADDFFDLASELRDELNSVAIPPPSAAADEQSLDDIFEEFKKGAEQQAVKEDVDTHYNLGVAYKEMGLLDDAIAEFVLTPEQEPKFVQSRYMLGLCYMEKGEYQTAIAELQSTLKYAETFGVDVRERIGMHYDLGLAFQGAGDRNNALVEFQKVCDIDPAYRGAANKVKELKQGDFISLEQLKDDIEREISSKFLEEGERIEREEKIRKNEKVRN